LATTFTSRFAAWADLDRRIWRLAWARAINTAGLSLVMAFLGVYVVDDRGYSAALYGVLALAANLGQSLASAWAGELSDRIGRRPLIVTALGLRAVAIAVIGVQILIDAPLWTLALNFVVSSTLRGCFEPVAYALTADVARPEQRVAAFGLQRMGVNLGWAIGPAAGGTLAALVPYGAVFFLAALGLLGAAAIMRGVVDPIDRSQPQPGRTRMRAAFAAALRRPRMVALLAATLLFALAQTQLFALFSIYMADRLDLAKGTIGLLYTVNGALVLLLQLPAIGVIDRIGIGRSLVFGALGFAAGFTLVGAAAGAAGAAAAVAVITASEVVFAPAHQTAAADSADPAQRGQTFGLVGFTQIAGVAIGPLIGGVLYDTVGDHHLALWGAIGGVCLALSATCAVYARLARA